MNSTDDKQRKAVPVFTGYLMYFPDVPGAVATVSYIGNAQHNPGEPMHWAREKSTDQLNTAQRHMMDHGQGVVFDKDGTLHLAKALWRLSAELQLTIERLVREGLLEPGQYGIPALMEAAIQKARDAAKTARDAAELPSGRARDPECGMCGGTGRTQLDTYPAEVQCPCVKYDPTDFPMEVTEPCS